MMHKIVVSLMISLSLFSSTVTGKNNNLTLAFIENYPPYSYQENGQAKGIHIEKINTLLQSTDVNVAFEFLPLQQALKKAKNGLVDGIVNVAYRNNRAQFLDYVTSPHWDNITISLYALNNEENLNNLLEKKATLAAKIGFHFGDKLRDQIKNHGVTLYRFSDIAITLELMQKGRIDGLIHADYEISTLKLNGTKLYKIEELLPLEPTYLAFSKKVSPEKALQIAKIVNQFKAIKLK